MKTKLVTIAAALGILIAGAAYAGIPGANGTISACRDNKGVLKVIDIEAGQSCANNQQPLTWNQQGPAGPQGPAGISGYEVVAAHAEGGPYTNDVTATAKCPEGKVPIAGGGLVSDSGSDGLAYIADSYPFAFENGWRVRAARNAAWQTQQVFGVSSYAVCAVVG